MRSVVGELIDDLRGLAYDLLAAGDVVLSNRVTGAINRLQVLFAGLDSVARGLETRSNNVVNNASSEVRGILGGLRADGARTGVYASARLNASLASISSSLNAVPFVSVDPSVLAIMPARLERTDAGRRIRVYGFLPGEVNRDVIVEVAGHRVEAVRGAGYSIVFHLPQESALTPGTRIPFAIRVRQPRFAGLWHRETTFSEELVVGKDTTFTCVVETYTENPSYLEQVQAKQATEYTASTQGSAKAPVVSPDIHVADLFAATMGAAADSFQLPTATFFKPGVQYAYYGADACGRGPSGKATISGSGQILELRLNAPEIRDPKATFKHGQLRTCGTGGTKVIASVRPTYRVARKGTPVLTRSDSITVRFGRSGAAVRLRQAPAGHWAKHISCNFADTDEHWSSPLLVLRDTDTSQEVRGLEASIAEDELILEPLDPIRFADDIQ